MRRSATVLALAVGVLVGAPTAVAEGAGLRLAGDSAVRSLVAVTAQIAAPKAGGGNSDPCSKPHPDPSCSQAPETPSPLLYPAAAAAALAVYFLIQRRRRRTRTVVG